MGNDSEWWIPKGNYITMPKALLRDPQYQTLSALAALLYALLLDRYRQSRKGGAAWQTESGAYFIYYPQEEISQRLRCGLEKAASLLRELEQMGLIRRSKPGVGKPCRIEVLPWLELESTDDVPPTPQADATEAIREQISYDVLAMEMDCATLDGIVSLIDEVQRGKEVTYKLMDRTVSADSLRQRLQQLEDMHIRYIADRLKQETAPIRNVRTYLLTLLYEAQDMMDAYYELWVNRDMGGPLGATPGAQRKSRIGRWLGGG